MEWGSEYKSGDEREKPEDVTTPGRKVGT